MAETRTSREHEKYWHARSAAVLAKRGEMPYAKGALEALASSDGLNLGDEALGFIRGAQASEEGVKTAINVYEGLFEEKRGEVNVGDLVGEYDIILEGISDDDKAALTGYFTRHSGETLNQIKDKVKKASYIIQDPTGTFTDDKKTEAREILEKYQGFLVTLDVLDNYMVERLRADAVDAARKRDLEGLVERL